MFTLTRSAKTEIGFLYVRCLGCCEFFLYYGTFFLWLW